MAADQYVVNLTNQALPTGAACTLLQYKAGSAKPAKLLAARISARGSNLGSNQAAFAILRKSAAATVTSFTPLLMDPGSPAAAGAGSTTGTGWNITTGQEGTDGDILVNWNANVLVGWQEIPLPNGRVMITPSGIIALKLMAGATVGVSVDAQLLIEEGIS